jgi:flagellar biosynthesis GTPase FlhF
MLKGVEAAGTTPNTAGISMTVMHSAIEGATAAAVADGVAGAEASSSEEEEVVAVAATSAEVSSSVSRLVSQLLTEKKFEVLMLALMTPKEIEYAKEPFLILQPIRENHFKRYEGIIHEDYLAMLEAPLQSARTNEELKGIFTASLTSAEFKKQAFEVFLRCHQEKPFWVEMPGASRVAIAAGAGAGAGGAVTKKIAKLPEIEAYFNQYYESFIAWQKFLFDQFFDEGKSFEENKLACRAFIKLITGGNFEGDYRDLALEEKRKSFAYRTHELQTAALEGWVGEVAPADMAGLKRELLSIVRRLGLSYPYEHFDLLNVIDAAGNTPLHLILSYLARERAGSRINLTEAAAIKNIIKLLPVALEKRSASAAGKVMTFEEVMALKNAEGVSIQALVISCGSDIVEAFELARRTGKFTGEDVNAPIPLPRSILAKIVTESRATSAPQVPAAKAAAAAPVSTAATPKAAVAATPEVAKKTGLTGIARELSSTMMAPKSIFEIAARSAELPGRKIDIPEDGNCFFHAVVRELQRHSIITLTQMQLRARGVAYLRAHPELLVAHPPERETYEAYLDRMAKNQQWAEGPIIEAIAKEFDLHFAVMELRNNSDTGREEMWPFHINDTDKAQALIGLVLKNNHYQVLELDEAPIIDVTVIDEVDAVEKPTHAGAGAMPEEASDFLMNPPHLISKNDLSAISTASKDLLLRMMMDEVTHDAWDSKKPDLSLLPPYNSPEKRARLACFAIDTKTPQHLLIKHLLAWGSEFLASPAEVEQILADREILERLDEAFPLGDAGGSIDVRPASPDNKVRPLYNIYIEVEYAEYLMRLWREDLKLGYFELLYQAIREAEKAAKLHSVEDLVALRNKVLAKLEAYVLESFLRLDRERRGLWLSDDAEVMSRFKAKITPILKNYLEAFVMWEQTSFFRIVNEDTDLAYIRASLRDLPRLIDFNFQHFRRYERIHSHEVETFYKQVSVLLTELAEAYPKMFHIEDVEKYAPVIQLFMMDPRNPACLMRYSHIFTHQLPFAMVIDDYGNNLLHRAYLRRNSSVSDWLVRHAMPKRGTDGVVHRIMLAENIFGLRPYKISELFSNERDISILYRALMAAQKTRVGGDASPISPLMDLNEHEKEIYRITHLVMERLPELFDFLMKLHENLGKYDAVLEEKKEESKKHKKGDWAIILKWWLASLFLRQKQEDIYDHREKALEKLAVFRSWIGGCISTAKLKSIKSAAELPDEIIHDVLTQAFNLLMTIKEILKAKGITNGRFKAYLTIKGRALEAIIWSSDLFAMTEKLAIATAREINTRHGKALLPTDRAYRTPQDLMLSAVMRKNAQLMRENTELKRKAQEAEEARAREVAAAKAEAATADAQNREAEARAKESDARAKESDARAKESDARAKEAEAAEAKFREELKKANARAEISEARAEAAIRETQEQIAKLSKAFEMLMARALSSGTSFIAQPAPATAAASGGAGTAATASASLSFGAGAATVSSGTAAHEAVEYRTSGVGETSTG